MLELETENVPFGEFALSISIGVDSRKELDEVDAEIQRVFLHQDAKAVHERFGQPSVWFQRLPGQQVTSRARPAGAAAAQDAADHALCRQPGLPAGRRRVALADAAASATPSTISSRSTRSACIARRSRWSCALRSIRSPTGSPPRRRPTRRAGKMVEHYGLSALVRLTAGLRTVDDTESEQAVMA